ncbi:MAG TPA: YggS family pyridoxal phosphate-dependent enzyme [Gemmatimonadaceae bacterium]|nr:YggS family pyridoxal phosphate-dependent enzyme [Gemmatimonadaceae bacterium]
MRDRIEAARRRGGHGQAVTIVAVTKTHGPDAVQAAYDAGLRDVGENRVQEALPKMDATTAPVRWHLIGHLQRNKVKALPRFDLLHSLDSARLADAVNELDAPNHQATVVLVQVNVAGEETKGGFERPEWRAEAERMRGLTNVTVRGVMTMAPLNADDRILRNVFAGTREARDIFRAAGHPATELSMGMSNDYEVAVEEGATLIRLGTILFGAREGPEVPNA